MIISLSLPENEVLQLEFSLTTIYEFYQIEKGSIGFKKAGFVTLYNVQSDVSFVKKIQGVTYIEH